MIAGDNRENFLFNKYWLEVHCFAGLEKGIDKKESE